MERFICFNEFYLNPEYTSWESCISWSHFSPERNVSWIRCLSGNSWKGFQNVHEKWVLFLPLSNTHHFFSSFKHSPFSFLVQTLTISFLLQTLTICLTCDYSDVVAIEPEWLPLFSANLCNLSDPLEDPPPFYDNEKDVVMCHVTGTFGPYCWPLPRTAIPFPTKDDHIFKWFARFLLEGHIHSFFSAHSSKLLTPASLVVKPWAKLQARTSGITTRLSQDRIASLPSLNKKWTSDPTCKFGAWTLNEISDPFPPLHPDLLTEYLDWLPQTLHDQVKKAWPPKDLRKE